ncbi:MAG: hypothetical protein ACOYMM_09285 [Phycisphaerales bacterium]|jgi:hypothetical protein
MSSRSSSQSSTRDLRHRVRSPLIATALLAGGCVACVALLSAASPLAPAPVPAARAPQDATTPDAAALVRLAVERIGGESWTRIKSFETIATVRSAVGDARVEFRFVAPDARQLVQVMPGGRGVLEMGVVGGVAWMGEPGRARAIDPKVAEEMSGGGDLQTLVHSLDTRFEKFEAKGKTTLDGREAWRVTMSPKASGAAPAAGQLWTVYIDAANSTILGIDIPAPPKDRVPNAPEQSGQVIRFRDWQSVEVPAGQKAGRMLGFRSATVESGGIKTELVYTKVAVDTLEKGAIAPPAKIDAAR